jgi:hypothetical protein
MSQMLVSNIDRPVLEEPSYVLSPATSVRSLVSLLCSLPDANPAKDLVSRTVRRVEQIRAMSSAANRFFEQP